MLTEELNWQEFINPLKIQRLINDFAKLSGISLIIMDPHGKRITSQTPPLNRLCLDIIKSNTKAKKNCEYCDSIWAKAAEKDRTHKIYTCKNGLVDFVTPIIIEDKIAAYLFGGQIRLNPKDSLRVSHYKSITKKRIEIIDKQIENGNLIPIPENWYINHAKRLNIDPNIFISALNEISFLSLDKIEVVARMLSNLAETISSLISRNVKVQKLINSNSQILFEIRDLINCQDITKKILDDLVKIVPYKKASLQLIEGNNRTLLDCRGFESFNIDYQYLKPISSDKLIKRIIDNRLPLILSNTEEDEDWQMQAGTEDVLSWIGAPIIYNNKVFGIITLDHNEKGFYDNKYINVLKSFLDKISINLRNTIVLNDAGSLISHMLIVNDIVKSINSEIEIQDILDQVVSIITKYLRCSHCTIFLLEKEKNKMILAPRAAAGADKITMGRKFLPGEGIAGLVFNSGKTMVIQNANVFAGFEPARVANDKPRSLLVAPIRAGNHTIGVISADQDEYNWFTLKDEQLVDALAQHIGIAIKRSNDIEIQKKLGKKILVLNEIDEILKTFVSEAINLLDVSTGVIYLFGKDGSSYINKYHPSGFNHPEPRLDKKDGLTRTIIDSGNYLSIPDIKKDDRVNALLKENYSSILGVPIKIDNVVLGVFFLNDTNVHNFTKSEISVLTTLADQAAIAIQNAELKKILNREHLLLDEVLISLIIEEQTQEEVLQKIGKGIITLLGGEVSPTINLFNTSKNKFTGINVYGVLENDEILKVPPRLKNGTGWFVIKTKQPIYLNDVNSPPKGCPTIRLKSRKKGIKSFAAIPLIRKGNIVGVLFINSLKKIKFDDKIRNDLEIFANQAALAIEISQKDQIEQISNTFNRAMDIDFIASGIPHEFKHYLQQFYSYSGLIIEKSDDPEIRNLAREMEEGFNQAGKSIDCFYKIRSRKNQIINFNIIELIQQIKDSLRDKFIEKSIDFKLINSLKTTMIAMNPTEIQSIIINLLKNSFDAISKNQKEKLIIIELLEHDINLIINFSDNGEGIIPENREYLFTPYFTTKSSGIGFGLVIIKKLIERNHGKIELVNNKTSLTTFSITLPVLLKS